MGVLNWAPEGHDDDLFMLQLAADADAWLVSNDTYSNHSSVRASLRNRLIPYMWAGFGKDKTAFTPKADKCAAFERSRAHRSNKPAVLHGFYGTPILLTHNTKTTQQA